VTSIVAKKGGEGGIGAGKVGLKGKGLLIVESTARSKKVLGGKRAGKKFLKSLKGPSGKRVKIRLGNRKGGKREECVGGEVYHNGRRGSLEKKACKMVFEKGGRGIFSDVCVEGKKFGKADQMGLSSNGKKKEKRRTGSFSEEFETFAESKNQKNSNQYHRGGEKSKQINEMTFIGRE